MMLGAVVALQAMFPIASLAAAGRDSEPTAERAGEDRWVASLAITSGVIYQRQKGAANSFLFEDLSPTATSLRGSVDGDDFIGAPFVGGALELMSPALPIPTRPRLFLSGEILPTFASDRELALEGAPGCVRGPEPGASCARDEDGSRRRAFGEQPANGRGTSTATQIDTLVFGANLGVSFPLQIGKRQLRIKPSVGWINYKVKAEGLVVDAACDPVDVCTDFLFDFDRGFGTFLIPGFLRETILSASRSQRFNGIGPGLDIEVDTGRFGPLGVSLFLGGRAYAILGDRTISLRASESFDDVLGTDRAVARFEAKVDPWIFRAHVGIRFQWLGSSQ